MKKILYDFNKERTVYRVYEGEPTIPITENLVELQLIDKKPDIDFSTQYFKDKKEILDLDKLTYTIEYIVDDKPPTQIRKKRRTIKSQNLKEIIFHLCNLREKEGTNFIIVENKKYIINRKTFLRNLIEVFNIEEDKVKKKDFLLHWYFSKTFSNDCMWLNRVVSVLGYDVEEVFDMEKDICDGD